MRRPVASTPESRRAANPAAYGDAMLVPLSCSWPTAKFGTLEYATPGTTMSGAASSPPRLENVASVEAALSVGDAPANTRGSVAPIESTRDALPGNPAVDSPGPSFDDATVMTTSGCAARIESTSASM